MFVHASYTTELFDLKNFDNYKEDNCHEVKKAEGGLPIASWESYSSVANSNGGVIILGVGERQGWKTPVVEETYSPDRTRLSLEFIEKQANKTSKQCKRRKTEKNYGSL